MDESKEISILNRDDWDNISNQIITYYWSNYEILKDKISTENILYEILKKLNVNNFVAEVQEKEFNNTIYFVNKEYKGGKIEIGDKSKGESYKSISEWAYKNGYNILLELQSNFYEINESKGTNKISPKFNKDLSYTTTNGWSNLKGDLLLQIPTYLKFKDLEKEISIDKVYKKNIEELISNHDSVPHKALQEVCLNILSLFTLSEAAFPFGKQIFGSTMNKSYNFKKKITYNGDIDDYYKNLINQETDSLKFKYSTTNNSQVNDRGGITGFQDDFEYLQFIPRMISYIWDHPQIGNKDHIFILNDQKELLAKLGYQIPSGLEIKVKPTTQILEINRKEKYIEINIDLNQYFSTLQIDIPAPPESYVQPIALSDLLAMRINEPFTTL
ncbi:hypothetical protein [Tenacibaculum xiamenense]|uniref:hypothetical protein n=1 Tax=Tenacibaculum xiamenense TaxID=1261553 RepID=UPI003894A2B1